MIGVAFVLLAVARPVWRLQKPDQTVAFAIDVSDSLDKESLQSAADHVVAATKELAAHQRAAVLVFAGRPKVVRPLRRDAVAFAAATDDTLGLREMVLHRFVKDEVKAEILNLERNLTGDDAQARLDKIKQRLAKIEAFEAEVVAGETDVREALRLARSLLPEDSRRRVVLFSDGNWTRACKAVPSAP